MCGEVYSNSSGPCLSTENELSCLTSEITSWTWREGVMWLFWEMGEEGIPPHPRSHWHANHSHKLILSAHPVLFPYPSISLLFPSLPDTAPSFICLCLHPFNIYCGSTILCKVLGCSSKESRCISCSLGTVNLVFNIKERLFYTCGSAMKGPMRV